MRMTLVIHILAGSLGILTGFVALYAAKGAPLHRRIGMFFVYTMLTMTATGTVIAAVRGAAPAMNIPAAIITAYLVVTGLVTVRPLRAGGRGLDLGAASVALIVGVLCLGFGMRAIAGGGAWKGMPAFPFFLFATIGLLGGIGDLRGMRAGTRRGSPRIARHLWRMSLALFIAAMSFFLGQADEIPKPIRIMPLLALPPFTVLGTMLYWLRRVRSRRSLRGMGVGGSPATTLELNVEIDETDAGPVAATPRGALS